MAYDDVKHHHGRAYTGMRVGGRHEWDYPEGRWREEKVAPDQWAFTFDSLKRRRRAAPQASGAPEGTAFHWFVMAHQRVRKVDENTYETFMEGSKWKVAHRRPAWRKWSSEFPAQTPARPRIAEILEETARGLRGEGPRLERALDPVVLRDRSAPSLDAWADDEAA